MAKESALLRAGPAFVELVERTLENKKELKRDAAKKIGITASTFSSYLTERAAFPMALVRRFAHEYGLNAAQCLRVAYGDHNCIAAGLLTAKDVLAMRVKFDVEEFATK